MSSLVVYAHATTAANSVTVRQKSGHQPLEVISPTLLNRSKDGSNITMRRKSILPEESGLKIFLSAREVA
jgi:hypothetical protein